jgi:hypothetical protein
MCPYIPPGTTTAARALNVASLGARCMVAVEISFSVSIATCHSFQLCPDD